MTAFDDVDFPKIRKALPQILAADIVSTHDDTVQLFRDLGKLAREAGIKVVVERGGPMDGFAEFIDNTINQKDS